MIYGLPYGKEAVATAFDETEHYNNKVSYFYRTCSMPNCELLFIRVLDTYIKTL